MKHIAWIAAGGIGVGIIASALAGVVDQERHVFPFLGNAACRDADGPETEKHFVWNDDDSIEIHVPGTVRYRGGEGGDVIVRGPQKLVDAIRIHGDRIESACNHFFYWKGSSDRDLVVTLPGRSFRRVGVAGSADLTMENVQQPELALAISGSGSVRAAGQGGRVTTSISGSGKADFSQLTMNQLDVQVSGSGRVDGATGNSERVKISVSGSGKVRVGELKTKQLDVHVSGSGRVEASPEDQADISISGSGTVTLLSQPTRLNSSVSGSGRIIQSTNKRAERGV